MSSITESTISGVKWTAIEKISVQIVNFVIGLVLARLLTPSDFGTIGMMGIFMAISQTFIDSGFSGALIRKNDVTEADYSTAFYFNIVVGAVCYAILFFCSPLVASFFKTPILSPVLKVYAVTLFIGSLTSAQYAKLNHELNFKLQARVSFASSLLSGALGVVLAYRGYGIWSLVWQAVVGSVLRTFLLWIFTRWYPKTWFSKDSFKYLFSYGSKMLASGLLHTLYENISSLVIGKFYTSEDLGYYARGEQFSALPSKSITGILQKVTFPILAKIQDDDERLIEVYRKYICMTSLVIMFLMTLLAALADPVIKLLLTDKWAEAIPFLQIFCFAMMFDHICQLNLNLLQVKGRSDLFLKLEIIKKSIAFIILIASIPFGVKAICISKIVYSQIAVFINTYYTGKLFNLGYWAQMKDFGKYLLLSAVSCVPALAVTFLPIHSIFMIIIGAVVSIALYVLFIRNDSSFQDICSIAVSKLRSK